MTNKVSVDQDFCQAHGRCYAMFPDLFEPDDEGRAQVKNHGAVPESSTVDEILAVCPEAAITSV